MPDARTLAIRIDPEKAKIRPADADARVSDAGLLPGDDTLGGPGGRRQSSGGVGLASASGRVIQLGGAGAKEALLPGGRPPLPPAAASAAVGAGTLPFS